MSESKESKRISVCVPCELPILDPAYKANSSTTLRELHQGPHGLARVRLPSGLLAWVVTRYELAVAVLNDIRFRKEQVAPGTEAPSQNIHPVFLHMLSKDPPEHSRLRALVSREFVSRRVMTHREPIEATCNSLVEMLAARPTIELLAQFAIPLSLATVCSIIGLPPEAAERLQRWTQQLIAADFDNPAAFPVIADEMCDYFGTLLDARLTGQDESLFGRLATRHAAGDLARDEFFAMVFLLVNAGYETSTNLIGNSVLALLENPVQWSALRADLSRIETAVEELLRFTSPLEMATARHASMDIELADTMISKGDTVFVALGAANRDGALFTDPDRLDISRATANRHIAFGHGIHFCLGAQVARLQAEIALRVLVTRLPTLRLDESKAPPRWQPGLIMRGLTHLHLAHGERPET